MLNSFKDSLHKVTDLTILFASIFTFLAFITPKEIDTESLERSKQLVSYNEFQLKDLIEAFSENQDSVDNIQRTIDQLNAMIPELDPDQDLVELQELAREIDLATANLDKVNSQSNDLQQNISDIESSMKTELRKIDNLESQLGGNKSISWVQPVRKNVESLANAAGMDGILAGFAALIFCLVCKRRKDWFSQIFRIYFK